MKYLGRLGLQQRVLPDYRVSFFDLLARACEGGLSVFAGTARASESIKDGELRVAQRTEPDNLHLFSGSLYLCYQPGFVRWLQDWDPDALIVEANPRYLATPAGVRWMKARGRPVIGWGLGSPPLTGRGAGSRQMRRLAFLRGFDALIAYSRRGADEYAALGYPREQIFVATNSVSPRPIDPPGPRTSHSAPSLLFIGRLQARKRVDRLLRACATLEHRPELVIVGDGPERGALEKLAADVYPDARFVGAKRGADVTPYFYDADLFVLPGTGGLAVQQAMSHGLPVLVARGDGTQDDLVRSGNGWQIPADDDAALVAALNEALSDLPRLERMGRESYRITAEEINIEKMVETFVDALRRVT